ncbi:hypothetical protein N8H09_17730 [Curtobacterium flaccumfaciens]|nr:hypothetical protein [Curtobacterium flaccumfaciens]
MDLLTLEHFAGSVNDTFSAALNEGEVPFVLVEARALPTTHAGASRAVFAAVPQQLGISVPQQTYRLRHTRLGGSASSWYRWRASAMAFCIRPFSTERVQLRCSGKCQCICRCVWLLIPVTKPWRTYSRCAAGLELQHVQ